MNKLASEASHDELAVCMPSQPVPPDEFDDLGIDDLIHSSLFAPQEKDPSSDELDQPLDLDEPSGSEHTFFHIKEMLCARPPRIRLYARVLYTTRESFSRRQYFQFRDLFKESPPYLPGILTWTPGERGERDAAVFLEPLEKGQVCRKCCVVGVLEARGGEWRVGVEQVRGASWREIRRVLDGMGRDDLSCPEMCTPI